MKIKLTQKQFDYVKQGNMLILNGYIITPQFKAIRIGIDKILKEFERKGVIQNLEIKGEK